MIIWAHAIRVAADIESTVDITHHGESGAKIDGWSRVVDEIQVTDGEVWLALLSKVRPIGELI